MSSIGRVFGPPLRCAVQNGGPSASGRHLGWPYFRFHKWGHPRWRPEAEGSPFCTAHRNGVQKLSPSLGWRHFRRRHLGSKMAVPQMTSGGRLDSCEDVFQTSVLFLERVQKRPADIWFYWKHLITSPPPNHSQNGWGSCPLATTGKSISLHVSTPRSMKRGVDFGKHLLYFFFLTVLYNSLELL